MSRLFSRPQPQNVLSLGDRIRSDRGGGSKELATGLPDKGARRHRRIIMIQPLQGHCVNVHSYFYHSTAKWVKSPPPLHRPCR